MEYPEDKYRSVSCNLCGGDNTEVLLVARDLLNNIEGEFRVVRCTGCGFVYTNPRPYGSELLKYYPDDAGYFVPKIFETTGARIVRFQQTLRKKVLAAFMGYRHLSGVNRLESLVLAPLFWLVKRNWEIIGIPPFREGGKILEVGCSYGSYLNEMRDLGWEVLGIEPNKKAAAYGGREFGLNIINDSFENVCLDDKFDVIALRMVLEHVENPSETLEKLSGLLKEDGRLIIIVPDFSGIEVRLFKKYCYCLQVPNHLSHFTPDTLRRFCDRHGFKLEKTIHHKSDRDFVASAWNMKNDGLHAWLAPILSNRLFRRTVLRAAVFLLSCLGMTSRMTVWAKKGA